MREITEDINLANQFTPKYAMEGNFTALQRPRTKLENCDLRKIGWKQSRLLAMVTPGIPKDFPFLKWPKLAMQRLINEGVDNADDAIGWIGGNQSASVRDQVKHIESFRYSPAEEKLNIMIRLKKKK